MTNRRSHADAIGPTRIGSDPGQLIERLEKLRTLIPPGDRRTRRVGDDRAQRIEAIRRWRRVGPVAGRRS